MTNYKMLYDLKILGISMLNKQNVIFLWLKKIPKNEPLP